MNKKLIFLSIFLMSVVAASAKKVKVTIDGTAYSTTLEKLYLVINEDTAHAQIIPLNNGKFSTTVEVDKNAFIRLHDYKGWPERSAYVLIPDSRNITIDMRKGTIEGSPMSQRLQAAVREARRSGPEGFHIDVFSDDQEEWRKARERERRIRAEMENEQRKEIKRIVKENEDNIIPAWIAFCFSDLFLGGIDEITEGTYPKWRNHPLLKLKKK